MFIFSNITIFAVLSAFFVTLSHFFLFLVTNQSYSHTDENYIVLDYYAQCTKRVVINFLVSELAEIFRGALDRSKNIPGGLIPQDPKGNF